MLPSQQICTYLIIKKLLKCKSLKSNFTRYYYKHYKESNTKLLTKIKSTNDRRFLSGYKKYQNTMDIPEGVFRGVHDRFVGITVDSTEEYDDCKDFPQKLQKSLDYWKSQKRRCIWFHVQTQHSDWVPHLTKAGFEFHHARKGYVTLYRWLPTDEYLNLPVYAHTMLGVGGLVANDRDEVLVVSDRYAMIPNSWKLPGGYAEPKENIIDAAIREVKEETGVISEFKTVVAVRHSHCGIYNTSDLYFVVALKPITTHIKPCEREIAKAKWMPFTEYLQHPNVHETNRYFLKTYLDYQYRGLCLDVLQAQHAILKIDYFLYSLKPITVAQKTENIEHNNKSKN